MLTLFTYELLFAWDCGMRRFCPLLFKFLPFDAPPPPPPVVLQALLFALYTGDRRCWLFVELVDDAGIDVLDANVVVVGEPLLSDRWSRQWDAK